MRTPQNKKRIWAADCESDPFLYGRVPIPFIWGVYEGYKENYWEFAAETPDDPNEETMLAAAVKNTLRFMEFIREQDVILYAHNGGKFDWHFITQHMEPGNPLLIIAGRLAKFEIGTCEFRDSYNLMPISLDQYQKSHIEYWKMERAVRHFHMPEIRTYLKSDCVNLWNMVNGFEKEYGRHLTQASAAMRIWQQRSRRKAPRTGAAFHDLFKPYYFGGRVQCFEAGDFEVPAKSADMRSAYPTAMLEEHPIGSDFVSKTGAPQKSIDRLGHYFFSVRGVARGAFPLRTLNGALYFPADDVKRTYTVSGWELQAAIETNAIEDWEILSHLGIDQTITFKNYVTYFWEERKKAKAAGDKGRDYYCKIFLNGLYGKFASDPRNYKIYELYPNTALEEIIAAEKDFEYFREWLLASSPVKAEKYRFYNLATAASITGLVRARMWRAIHNSTRPFYCDTDSITAINFKGLEIGDELGQWSYEGDFDRLVIAGKKMYAFHITGREFDDWLEKRYEKNGKPVEKNWKKATKGANLTAEDLIRVAHGEAVRFMPQVPTFSVHTPNPRFVPRVIKATATNISIVPKHLDPEFAGGPPNELSKVS
jgi:DNA polymerase elongation subunit (family B)